jgi:AraC family transcriptional regulator
MPAVPDITDDVHPTHANNLAASLAFIGRNFRRKIPLDEIAAVTDLSPFHFHRVFRRAYKKTPKQVVLELRVAEVQRLALQGTPLAVAAKAVGFSHQSHMTTQFKMLVGATPKKWLKTVGHGSAS